MALVLETERLILRHLADSDLDAFAALCADPELMRLMGDGETLSREIVEKWLDISKNNYVTKGYGASALIHKANAEFIGFAGLVYSKDLDAIEIIYCLKQAYWGKGLITEIAKPLLVKGLTDWDLPAIYATIDHRNTASIRVVEKIGMRYLKMEIDPDGSRIEHYIFDTASLAP